MYSVSIQKYDCNHDVVDSINTITQYEYFAITFIAVIKIIIKKLNGLAIITMKIMI